MLRMLFGGRCSNCGVTERKRLIRNRHGKFERHSNLQFHHLDKATKVVEVTAAKTRAAAIEEARKCVLLCTRCHDNYHECIEFFERTPANDNQQLQRANDTTPTDAPFRCDWSNE